MRLSAAIVTYFPDRSLLERALRSLGMAIERARRDGALASARVFLIDNGDERSLQAVRAALAAAGPAAPEVELRHGHGNVGYGRANNLVLPALDSDAHLVMNPDVEVAEDAIAQALRALSADPRVGALAPSVHGAEGERQYLCKRYPSVWVLFLRGFAPGWMRQPFRRALDSYEMRDVDPETAFAPVPLASGCFLVVRTELFSRLQGFDAGYFMYFEDYDLSVRLGREAQLTYVPGVKIVHHGGEASRKGWRHVAWFLRSAWRFFATHGWKIA
jgi:GT2 family glycosyltransferase